MAQLGTMLIILSLLAGLHAKLPPPATNKLSIGTDGQVLSAGDGGTCRWIDIEDELAKGRVPIRWAK